eukprot:CAMPEP_0197046600 /NCGR_PEP_ID=MMETSP1384-20130603/22298_1 /TAXON_ID=29189 /ORGANISM="Ammonia sp." /LENGTH=321 /DNA_ID=CAMNT_0042478425 /DNA_START=44 /DNA_END=1009 /DNA_ORIENTATION=+
MTTKIPRRIQLLIASYLKQHSKTLTCSKSDILAICNVIGQYYFEMATTDHENIIIVCSTIIFPYLRLPNLVTLSFVSKWIYDALNLYYQICTELDLSDYYGVIGNHSFHKDSFYHSFLPKFSSVQSLSLRYCSHLKAVHLDAILKALTSTPSIDLSTALSSSAPLVINENETLAPSQPAAAVHAQTMAEFVPNDRITSLDLYFCSRIGSSTLFKIRARLPNLENLNIGRCYTITANKNVNGFKALESLPLRQLTISLDPSITKEEATDIYTLLMDEDSFRSLKVLDLSYGCTVMLELDLDDHEFKSLEIIKPIKQKQEVNV